MVFRQFRTSTDIGAGDDAVEWKQEGQDGEENWDPFRPNILWQFSFCILLVNLATAGQLLSTILKKFLGEALPLPQDLRTVRFFGQWRRLHRPRVEKVSCQDFATTDPPNSTFFLAVVSALPAACRKVLSPH